MRISDWSSDVCSSDLRAHVHDLRRAGISDRAGAAHEQQSVGGNAECGVVDAAMIILGTLEHHRRSLERVGIVGIRQVAGPKLVADDAGLHNRGVEQISLRSEEHTSDLQSLMRISSAVLCLKKKNPHTI